VREISERKEVILLASRLGPVPIPSKSRATSRKGGDTKRIWFYFGLRELTPRIINHKKKGGKLNAEESLG